MKQQTNNRIDLFSRKPTTLYICLYNYWYYAYLEQVCKLVHFFRVVRSTGRVPNLNTNHCIYACYVHFYKKFSEIL